MKKAFAILIFLTLALLAVFPVAAFADEGSDTDTATFDTTNLRLVNPVAVCAVGNNLFIADNITDNNSIVLCFGVEGTPTYKFTTSFERPIVNLSETNGKLAVIHADGVDKYDISGDKLTLNNEGSQIVDKVGIVDVTYGHVTWDGSESPAEFYVNGESLCYYTGSNSEEPATATDAIACLEFNGYVYFLYISEGAVTCKRFNEAKITYDSKDTFNTTLTLGLTPKGIFSCKLGDEDKLVLYSDTSLCFMTNKSDSSAFYFESEKLLFNYAELTKTEDGQIVDACSNGSKVFVLNNKNEVEIFSQTQTDDGWKFELEENTIGTDTITLNDLPQIDSFNSYTLAKSTGYPTNIVYKTTDEKTSISDVKTDYTDTFIVLGFDGADKLPFYYVLIGNRFGWVKKSDNTATVTEDENIAVLTTTPVDVTQKAKFLSFGQVNVYKLPTQKLSDGSEMGDVSFSQTAETVHDVTVLQHFTEVDDKGNVIDWYYVEYEHNGKKARGFVPHGTIGKFYTAAAAEGIPYEDDMKINASLFEGVKLYLSEEMTENNEICNSEGNIVKLRSGAMVKAIKKNADGTATYIEATQGDEVFYGWIPTDNLIDRHNVTTNAAVGLCILVAASFCALVLLLLFKHRNKKNDFEDEE